MPSLKIFVIFAIFIFFLAAISLAISKKGVGKKTRGAVKPRDPLTKNEQPMYFRITEAFADDVVLAQVAFSALIDARDRATRNTFDRKVADFVLCTKAFKVRAVIELDDSSHKGREKEDMARSELLTDAGYKVLRYRKIPDIATLQNDVNPPEIARAQPKSIPEGKVSLSAPK